MDLLVRVIEEYGLWGLVLAVLVYIILRGQIGFRYPRRTRKSTGSLKPPNPWPHDGDDKHDHNGDDKHGMDQG